MTEEEWLACADPDKMLEFIRENTTERKLRLCALACCSRVWSLLTDERSRRAIIVAENWTDGLATLDELDEARENASDACGTTHNHAVADGWTAATWVVNAAANAAYGVCGHHLNWLHDVELFETPLWSARAVAGPEVEPAVNALGRTEGLGLEMSRQCQFFRCVIGNPFRPVTFNQTWITFDVRMIATGTYEDKAFERLPILADALEDAGCDNMDILSHLRGDGPHVRGCWALDLILGKS
ncbi:hypothetical protein [Zavarzinella formosa]|uniref:hypothetical protein n=1 Tax=Zavarzinella formosa TaxID=360055 RepID=UPI00037F513C|nr:hypothetical protein [Zavarzinella formosa]